MYMDTPVPGQGRDVVVLAVSGSAVMVLVLAACVCWRRNSSGLVSNRGDSRRDTVPLDDLLSKPSLADPESVFSEAGSNDFRPIPRAGSRFVASGDENSFWPESGSVSGASHGDRDTSSSHLLAGLNNDPDPNTGLPRRKDNYQGKQLIKSNKSAQQLELEQLQNRQNVDNEATSRSDCSHPLKSTADRGQLGDRFVHDVRASVHTTSGSPKTGSHKDISQKVGLDAASLKIHRDSVPADSAPFLSPARCSFSHEVGHIVHGNQTPRPSLPRTEEVENDQADSSPDSMNVKDSPGKATRLSVEVKATELSVNVHSEYFEELPPANLTFNSQGQVRGQGLLVNETRDSNHRVWLGCPQASIQDSQQPAGEIIGSTTVHGYEIPDISCQISHPTPYVNNQVSTGRPASDLDQCRLAGVTMRRCLSCVQGDAVCPEPATKPRRQTFSLNLKIDVHFDNERESCENLPTVVCSPLMEYARPGNQATAVSCQRHATSVSINKKNNNNNNSINNSHSHGGCHVDTDAKERQLEKSFADKSLHRNSHTFASAGKQCSGVRMAEFSQVKTCNTGQPSRRLSESLTDTARMSESLTDTATASVVGPEGAARSGVTALEAAGRNLAATAAETAGETTTAAGRNLAATAAETAGETTTTAGRNLAATAAETAGETTTAVGRNLIATAAEAAGETTTAAGRNLAAIDAETAGDTTTAASSGDRARQGVSASPAGVMTEDAGGSRADRIAADARVVRQITVMPTKVEDTATADSDSGIFPTQGQLLPKAVVPGAESNTDTDRADVSPGAETNTKTDRADVSAEAETGETGAGPSLGTVVPVSVAGGDRLLVAGRSAHGGDVVGISNSTLGQNEHSCDVTHILRETEPVGRNGKSQGKVTVAAEIVYQEKRSNTSRIKDDNIGHIVGATHNHTREDSYHPAMVNTTQTSISISDTNHPHPEDAVRAEAVVSSQRVDGSGHSKAEHSKPKSTVATTLSGPRCEGSTNTQTHSDSNLSEETTDTKTQADSHLSGESVDTKTHSNSNVSGESTETKTQLDSNVSGESTATKTHSDDRLTEETNDANRAGSVHPPDEGSVKQTAAADGHTKRPDIQRRALTVKEGHVRTMSQTNQTGDSKFQRSASVKTSSVHERPRPSLGSADKRQDRRQAVFFHDMTDLSTESPGRASREETHGEPSEQAAPAVAARTQGRLTGSKVDTNTLNNQDHVTLGFNQGGPETPMKGHTQMMKQRLTGSALCGHAATPAHKREQDTGVELVSVSPQDTAVELVSVSPQDQGTVPRTSTKAPRPAPRRWPAGADKRDSPAHEPDVSAISVIAINIENCTGSTEAADVSDDSDYDNPWDSLDEAVKRASIRYNRRPSRIAAGDSKTLLLKSAEDLGRLLEEADKRRQFRQTRNSCQVVSPETDSFTIPFTRFSPYRHTVKDTVSQSQMATAHSTETLLKTETPCYPQLSLLRPGDAVAADHRVLDARRPMSLTSKVRAKITNPETKPRKK